MRKGRERERERGERERERKGRGREKGGGGGERKVRGGRERGGLGYWDLVAVNSGKNKGGNIKAILREKRLFPSFGFVGEVAERYPPLFLFLEEGFISALEGSRVDSVPLPSLSIGKALNSKAKSGWYRAAEANFTV